MKVKITVDSELVPIIVRALNDYTDQSIKSLVAATTPASKDAPPKSAAPKKRGRPRGSTTRAALGTNITVGSVSAAI
jgi:hypothetical protein